MSTAEDDEERGGVSTGRVLAFSDGVFAIAFTLLTLDLVIPDGLDVRGLAEALRENVPHLLSALLGFAVIGRFWIAHHYLFDRIRVVDRPLLVINLLLLAPIALVPPAASMVADYGDRTSAVLAYAVVVTAAAGGQLGVWLWASRGFRLLGGIGPDDARPATTTASLAFVFGVFAVSVPVAVVSVGAAQVLWVVAVLPVGWLTVRRRGSRG